MFNRLFKKTDYKLLLQNGALILDVRSAKEFEGGSILGSENIPLQKLTSQMSVIKGLEVPVIVVCASGMRSGVAKGQLKASGVEVYNAGAWTNMIRYVY